MTALIVLAGQLVAAPYTDVPVEFWGVAPEVSAAKLPKMFRKKDKAVVLIHGLVPRVFRSEKANEPEAHSWQKPKADLAKQLSENFDVFGVSYAQVGPVDWVANSPGMREGIALLKAAGYQEIVLIGHSAGGLIARRFAESYPESGVTKVIAVAAPHLGSPLAKIPDSILPKTQRVFIHSLLPEEREQCCKNYDRKFPDGIQFCCIVCKMPRLTSDTVVDISSQWPKDLQKLGVPAKVVICNHFEPMTNDKSVEAILELTKGKIARWTPEEVSKAQKVLFGDKSKEK